MIEMLTTPEALAELERLERYEIELLGLDGFKLDSNGKFEAPIDLILDFTGSSAPTMPPVKRFYKARQFVTANDAPQVRWEIVSGAAE